MESPKPDGCGGEALCAAELQETRTSDPVKRVSVYDNRPEGYDGSCLRPLGLCELGGACDACWYSPDHPRFNKKA